MNPQLPAHPSAGKGKLLPVLFDAEASSAIDASYKDIYRPEVTPSHPGEVLRDDILPHLGIKRSALAKALGISQQRLSSLLAERTPVTPDLALRLGTVVGYGARYWLGLQIQRDIWQTAQSAPSGLKPIAWKRSESAAKRAKPQKSQRQPKAYR